MSLENIGTREKMTDEQNPAEPVDADNDTQNLLDFTKIDDDDFTLYMLKYPQLHEGNIITLPHKMVYKNPACKKVFGQMPDELLDELTKANEYEFYCMFEKAEECYKKLRDACQGIEDSFAYKLGLSINRVKVRHILNQLRNNNKDYPTEKLSMSDPDLENFNARIKNSSTSSG